MGLQGLFSKDTSLFKTGLYFLASPLIGGAALLISCIVIALLGWVFYGVFVWFAIFFKFFTFLAEVVGFEILPTSVTVIVSLVSALGFHLLTMKRSADELILT